MGLACFFCTPHGVRSAGVDAFAIDGVCIAFVPNQPGKLPMIEFVEEIEQRIANLILGCESC